MIEGGYYIKARCIQDSEISYAPPYTREIWDWLLKEANHTDKKYGKFIVKRGQLFRTYNDIREGLHWMIGWRKEMYHENQVKRAMKFLRSRGMVDTTKAPRGTLITICNYDTYQDPKNYERTNESTNESTQPVPGEYPGSSTSDPAINKNDKNFKNGKNVKKEEGKKEEKKNPLHSQCTKIYFDWFIKKFDLEPQFDGGDGKAMKGIINLLEKNVKKPDGIVDNNKIVADSWQWILDNYGKWDKVGKSFYKDNVRLRQIASNLTNILINLRNETGEYTTSDGFKANKEFFRDLFEDS